jgi:polysaccharide pyruvyl transferase WcaK-like protein
MTLFIAGGYSCGNPGDEAILKSTVYRLNELFPGSRFVIWTDSKDFHPYFDRDIDHEIFYWKPLAWRRGEGFFPKAATKLYVDLYPASKAFFAGQPFFDRQARATLRRCDKVVFVGGGYINSDFCLLETNYLAAVAAQLGKPICLLGQTLGPFDRSSHQRMADDIFRCAQTIVLRDTMSNAEVSGHEQVWVGSDDAVAFTPKLSAADRALADGLLGPADGRLRIGLNLRDWKDSRAHYSRIARAIEWFAGSVQQKVDVVFIPMETSRWCDDRLEAGEFGKHLSPAIDLISVKGSLTVEQTHHLIGRMDLLVGMRLHALVFALSSGVPTIGLYQGDYYHRKIAGLFASFRMEDQLLPLDRLEELGPLMRTLALRAGDVQASLRARREGIIQEQQNMLERAIRSERAA